MVKNEIQIDNGKFFKFVEDLLEEGYTATVKCKGKSMRPMLEDNRDSVLLTRFESKEVHKDDILLVKVKKVKIKGEERVVPMCYVLHRVIKSDGFNFIMQGDGNVNVVEMATADDVVASVVGFYRKGSKNLTRVDSFSWRIYSLLWNILKPVRRYLLYIDRHLLKK